MLKRIAVFLLLAVALALPASAADMYVSQSGAGDQSGATDCTHAKPYSALTTSGNWVPDRRFILCGTFSFSGGAQAIAVLGSGTNGHPITILFSSGAVLTAPYWAHQQYTGTTAAISCDSHDWIVLDGGTNGHITSTANGTLLTYQQFSEGVNFTGCNNIEIKNLLIDHIYDRSGHGDDGDGTADISIGYCDHVKIHDNTLLNSRFGIIEGYGAPSGFGEPLTDLEIYNNRTDYHVWQIQVGDGAGNSTATNIRIHHNHVGPHFDAWQDIGVPECAGAQDCFHADGIFLQTANPNSSMTNVSIHDNFVEWDGCTTPGGNCTGLIFATVSSGLDIFNNIFQVVTGGTEGIIRLADTAQSGGASTRDVRILQNTFIDSGGRANASIKSGGGTNFTVENNIFKNVGGLYLSDNAGFGYLATSDYNNINLLSGSIYVAADNSFSGNSTRYDLAAWHAYTLSNGTNPDVHSFTTSTTLDSSFIPSGGAVGRCLSLHSLGIQGMDLDYYGAARPTSGAVDCGAVNSGSSASLLVVTTNLLPSGVVGSAYTTTTLQAANGTPPYTWTWTGGAPGLSLSTGGVITGTPTTAGTYSEVATVHDSVGATASQTFPVTITNMAPGGVVTIQGKYQGLKF